MANSKCENNLGSNGSETKDDRVEVLYQKMGDRWFAFSLVENEVFVGSISQEEMEAANAAQGIKTYRVTGNS